MMYINNIYINILISNKIIFIFNNKDKYTIYHSLTKKKYKDMLLIRINLIDYLYYVIIPRFNKLLWYTTKYYNFKYFSIAVSLLIRGLHHLKNGYKCLITNLCNSYLIYINNNIIN